MMFWDDRYILGIGLFIMILILVLVLGGIVFLSKSSLQEEKRRRRHPIQFLKSSKRDMRREKSPGKSSNR